MSVLLAAAAVALPAVGASGAGTPLITLQIEGGYGGVVPQGGWAPVQVDVVNHGPAIVATLKLSVTGSNQNGFGGPIFPKGIAVPAITIAPGVGFPGGFIAPGAATGGGGTVTQKLDIVLPAGTTKHFAAYLPANPGTWKADLITTSGKNVATATTQVSQANSSLSIAVVSDDSGAMNQIASIQSLSQTFQGQPQLIHLTPAALPDVPAALSSFGLVAVTNATTDSLSGAQRHALDDYAAQGGTVLVTGGNAWHKTQAGLPADLLAMDISGVQSLPGLPGLASALGSPAVPGPVDVATGTRRTGVTVFADGQVPILVDAAVGRGRVLYSTIDPSAEPVASWSGTLPLLRQIVVRAAAESSGAQNAGPFAGGGAGRGIQSQGSSLYQALSNIPSLDLPSPLLIALALIVFIVLIGPVNYFFLRRIHRPDLAWGTIPLLVVMSAGSIYGIGLKTRGTDVLADRVRLVYLQNGSNRAYVDGGTGVFAPHAGSHAVSTVSGSLITTLSGGSPFVMGGAVPIPQLFPTSSGATGSLTINQGTPPTVGMTWPNADSIQAFGEEYAETQPGTLDAHLAVTNGRLTGTIVNHTPTTMTDGVVLSGTSYSTVGAIRPGASVNVDIPLPAAGSVNAINGPTFSLPQQIYLHAPASCTNGPCVVPGLTFPLGRPTAKQREAQRRSDVLGGILGANALDVAKPMFVAWSTAASGAVRVDAHRAQLNELTAYILPLEAAAGTGTTLVAGRVTARAVDATGYLATLNMPGSGIGAFLPPNGSTTFEFALGSTGWQTLTLTEGMSVNGMPGFGSAATTVYNFRTSTWDPLTLSTTQPVDIPAPADHTSPDGLFRLRVTTGNNPAQVGTVDISGQKAGPA